MKETDLTRLYSGLPEKKLLTGIYTKQEIYGKRDINIMITPKEIEKFYPLLFIEPYQMLSIFKSTWDKPGKSSTAQLLYKLLLYSFFLATKATSKPNSLRFFQKGVSDATRQSILCKDPPYNSLILLLLGCSPRGFERKYQTEKTDLEEIHQEILRLTFEEQRYLSENFSIGIQRLLKYLKWFPSEIDLVDSYFSNDLTINIRDYNTPTTVFNYNYRSLYNIGFFSHWNSSTRAILGMGNLIIFPGINYEDAQNFSAPPETVVPLVLSYIHPKVVKEVKYCILTDTSIPSYYITSIFSNEKFFKNFKFSEKDLTKLTNLTDSLHRLAKRRGYNCFVSDKMLIKEQKSLLEIKEIKTKISSLIDFEQTEIDFTDGKLKDFKFKKQPELVENGK